MIKNGTIPENITIVSNGQIKPYRYTEDLGEEKEEFFVTPAYAVDSASESMVKTAERWAKSQNYYDEKSRKYVPKNEFKIENRKNEPIGGLRILGLEHRGNGGRAYKVVMPDNYYFDLREDVLLDTILNEGILKGGELGGEFVWGKIGSQMKLIRTGSKLYNELSESSVRRSLKKFDKKELKIGGLYEDKNGQISLFLGWFSTIKIEGQPKYGYNRTTYDFSSKKISKTMAFLKFYSYSKLTPREEFEKWVANDESATVTLELKTAHSLVREADVFNIPPQISILISNNAISDAQKYNNFSDIYQQFNEMCYYSSMINLVPYGEPVKIHSFFNNLRPRLL